MLRLTGFLTVLLLAPAICLAQAPSREEALAAVYPGAQIRAEQLFLTPAQQQQAAAGAGSELSSALIARYIATVGTNVVGRAYVDTHTIRTKRESLLIALDALGKVLRVEVTAFLEPLEYKAPEPWLRQYRGRELSDGLAVNRAIRPLAGATLTTRATNAAVRRILAIDTVLSAAAGVRQ